MKNSDYNKFKGLAKYINQLLETGKWNDLRDEQQNVLKNTLNRLMLSLERFVAKRNLTRVLGAAVMLISSRAIAQSFEPPVGDPFGINTQTYLIKPNMVDLDGDGDLDFLHSHLYVEGFLFQENIGTAEAPEFDEAVLNPFGLSPESVSFFTILGDIDNDGDLDIFTTDYDDGITLFYENTGTPTDPEFTSEVANPFGIVSDYHFLNSLIDIDDDGDLDLIVSNYDDVDYNAHISFWENTGTPESPSFATPVSDPFGIDVTSEDYFSFVDFTDFDGDGDYDFIRNEIYGQIIYYHENIGSSEAPNFASGSGLTAPFDLSPLTEAYLLAPVFADIDNDGDYDLFYSGHQDDDEEAVTLFFENKTSLAGINETKSTTAVITVYPNPANTIISLNTDISNENIATVRIMTVDGRAIYQSANFVQQINLADYPNGMYILELTTISGTENRTKFIKN